MRTDILYLLAFVYALFGCNQPPAKNTDKQIVIASTDSIKAQPAVATPAIHDSSSHYKLIIKGAEYYLELKEGDIEPDDAGDLSPVLVTIKNATTGQTILNRAMPYNAIGDIYSPAPDKYWLSLFVSGGGSGYTGTLFDIIISDTVGLRPILNFNELFCWKSNKTATEILGFQGIWNMGDLDSDDFESHFSAHTQIVRLYTLTNDTVRVADIGTTKTKYEFTDDEDALNSFRNNDPIAKKINWNNYALRNRD